MITNSRRLKDLIRNLADGDATKAQMLLRHFAMERLLERLSVSQYANDFIIKGGMLISSLIGMEERMTRDIDVTMRGHDLTPDGVRAIIDEISRIEIGDGFTFELGEPIEIMEDSKYGGIRIPIQAQIERTRTSFKMDVSTGDALTPGDVAYNYKLMFEERTIPLRSYNTETALAEKLETIITLATQNTRMRDFYDVHALMHSDKIIDYGLLGEAIEATMTVRRCTLKPHETNYVLALLQESTIMPTAWERYKKSNPFADGIAWVEVLDSLRAMLDRIEKDVHL